MENEKNIERKGHTFKRALLYGAVALFIASTVGNTVLNTRGIDTGLGLKVAAICLILGTLFALAVAVIGNFIRAFIWKRKGYDGTPVAMVFGLKAQGKITKTSDILLTFDSMLPEELLEELCSTDGTIGGSEVSKEVASTERKVLLMDLAILAILATLLFIFNQPVVASSLLFAMALIAIIAFTRTKSFHGTAVKSRYYKMGFGVYYVLRQAAAMGLPLETLLDEFTDMETDYFEDKLYDYFGLVGWQGVFLEKACSETDKPRLSDLALSFVKNERLYGFTARDLTITRERLNLNNIYMCYTLIQGSEEDKENLIAEFYDKITVGSKGAGAKLKGELDWRRSMLAGEAVDLNAYPLFKPVDFMKAFPAYQEKAAMVRDRVRGEA